MSAIAKYFLALAVLPLIAAAAQDAPSLGDLARRQKQQKQQSPEKPAKVITNADLPEHSAPPPPRAGHEEQGATTDAHEANQNGDRWRSQILDQKRRIETLQHETDELNESIRFAPPNCASGCIGWNERQREKQQRVEAMQSQLQEERKRLDDMQDAARKQGFGSAIYDP